MIQAYKYYISLLKFEINPSLTQQLTFRLKLTGSCDHRFILLSNAVDLASDDYYEIFISKDDSDIRRKYWPPRNMHYFNDFLHPCSKFRQYTIYWNRTGRIHVIAVNDDGLNVTIHDWIDPDPIEIRGVGIKTGFGNEGLWTIKINGN